MIKKTVARIVLGFIGLSVIAPLTVSGAEIEKCTISHYEAVAGISYTVDNSLDKKIKKHTLSESDFELICRTVFCEAGNQDVKTQEMVALTILNRVNSNKFPNTIKGVVYQKNAYAVTNWKNFESYKWTKQVEKAVKQAIKKNKHPKNMFYFRTKHFHRFGKAYIKSGDLWFSTES